ncbi:MAG: hypothetical protein EZS28_041728, partial [Streblomastix strix]
VSLVARMRQQFDKKSSTPALPNYPKLAKGSSFQQSPQIKNQKPSQPLQFENINPPLTNQTEEITHPLELEQENETQSEIPTLTQITPIQDQIDAPEKQNEEYLITDNQLEIKQQEEKNQEKQVEVEKQKRLEISNILKENQHQFNNQWEKKDSDFGLSRAIKDGKSVVDMIGGTYPYLAPELLKALKNNGKRVQNSATDVWACGIILYELLAHFHPFLLDNNFADHIIKDEIPELPESVSQSLKDLVKQMLEKV